VRAGAAGAGGGRKLSVKRRKPFLGDWRAVRAWEHRQRLQLRKRHALWLHGWCIGAIVLGTMWAVSHLQWMLGMESLAWRYAITLGVGYAVFLVVLRVWAGMLVGEEAHDPGDPGGLGDAADAALDALPDALRAGVDTIPVAGGGGDFGGGGAHADFGDAADAVGAIDASSAAGDIASGALEAAGSADEGAIIVIPVVAVFLIGCLILFGAGSLLLLYFGWEVLLTAAVEIAFSYVSARTAVRVVGEGWLMAAVRLTWKPLLGTLVCAVALGAMVDHFLPQADTLPQAIKMLRNSGR
jgi:hypothetical protein